ncbi:MAG TPA: phosphatidylserine decarboxylase family protein [Ignavibacteriaceae bacterium]|jgi:phosphatidylserine decarboxylase|nr:phosphatidylserine decarboxylase family protein [Ignavibacteriaceae bacterium]
MLTKYGYSTLAVISVITFVLISLNFFTQNNFLRAVLIIVPLLLLAFSINFFRDPDRIPPVRDDAVVSPADGKVLFVKDVIENNFIKGNAKQVSIFMSPLNVHVNRIPVTGKVEYLKYFKGEYIAAFEDKASEVNERAEFGISGKYGKVFFTQVAGFIARRIIYEISPGDSVKIGERFGMIKFGSRVDVIVPENCIVKVRKDDEVKAGETILFEYPKN